MRTSIATAVAAALLLGLGSARGADLLDVYQTALERDPSLTAAAAARQAAEEALPQARANLRPQISAGADWTYNMPDVQESSSAAISDDAYDALGYTLSLSQSLYNRSYAAELRQADATVARAEAEYTSTRQTVAVRVAGAYFDVLAAEDTLEFAEAEQKAIGQQLRQTKQRFEVGLSAITDVHEAQAGYDAAVARVIAARNQVDVAREILRAITDRPWPELAPLGGDMPLIAPEPTDIDAWVDTALDQNLDLAAVEAAARAVSEGVELARATRYPEIDLIAQHGYTDNLESTFGARRFDNAIGVQLSVPLYLGGAIDSRIREASHLYDQALAELEAQRRSTVQETREAYLAVTTGISQVEATRQALSSAKTALDATQAGFEVGTRTAVDVLDAQQELFRARRDYARARYDYILAILQLKRAAGILTPEDIAQVNSWLKNS